ncbi:MAG: hypothetical protein IT379_12445, partial [Deltaproteobacteria bacterium]|nr:hypothetical protein [Deltaproteobacteria bacterium]
MMRISSWMMSTVLAGVVLGGCALEDDGGGARQPLACDVTADCPGTSTCEAAVCACTADADCGPDLECEHG